MTDVAGVPEIAGARFAVPDAVILKAGSDATALPSVTLILMLDQLPAALGVPANRPVDVENVAQPGLLEMLKRSRLGRLSGSRAVGVKEYAEFTVTVAGGVPEIVGGLLVCAVLVVGANAMHRKAAKASAAKAP